MNAIVTVIGKDKVGIIAAVCALLAENNVNILDISQTILQGSFTMVMAVDVEKAKVPVGDLRDLLEELGRMNYYFKIFEIVFYSGALNRPLMAKSEKADKLVKGAVMALLVLLGLYTLYTYGGLIPYRFVWQG